MPRKRSTDCTTRAYCFRDTSTIESDKTSVIMRSVYYIRVTGLISLFFLLFLVDLSGKGCSGAVTPARLPAVLSVRTPWSSTPAPLIASAWIWKPLSPSTSRQNPAIFWQSPQCATGNRNNVTSLPDLGLDYEVELEGLDESSNLTFKTATFADGSRRLGVVAMDFLNHQELFLYNLKTGQNFRVEDNRCVTEPLAACNPLAYFLLRGANKSPALAVCKFESSNPVFLGQHPVLIRGTTVYRWEQCLRLQAGRRKHVFHITFFYRLNIFASNPVRKYVPWRLEAEEITAETEDFNRTTSSTGGKTMFNFISFRSRLRNRSMFQVAEYRNCTGWDSA
ncbi:hypothetical protein RvY_05624-2 [Ramazzottius varieornatus]|uniref:Uncharacterized protein n=1 Tax=Ramazzottius varieornatus TaxID=947166 RepID=A0A1D1V1A2_RAMVA|nr:hypothetical protein RvY_05624-2 [Ramazzottius varieornatus]